MLFCLAVVVCLFQGCATDAGRAAWQAPSHARSLSGVPFFPDESQQCGPASLAGVMGFLGAEVSPAEVSEAVYRPGIQGSLGLDMMLYARSKGLQAAIHQGGPRDLMGWIDEGLPLLVMVDNGLGPVKKLHYLVVIGYAPGAVTVNSGLQPGLALPWEEFLPAWQRTGFWSLRLSRPERGGRP